MAIRYSNPKVQYFYANGTSFGEPLVDGFVYFYDSGTLNLKDTYADSGLSIANPNPMRLDGAGRISAPFLDGNYRVIVQDDEGVQQFELDPIQGSLAGGQWEDWDITTTYSASDLVRGSDNFYYRSITNNNLGNNPVASETDWSEILFIVQWNENETYALNDNVIQNGTQYKSLLADNLNNPPDTSPAEWGVPTGGVVAGNPVSLLVNDVPYLDANNNLSDVVSASTSRNNLGLGTAATVDTGTGAGDVPLNSQLGTASLADTGTGTNQLPTTSQADARYLVESNNLSDLPSDATARTNLDVYSKGEANGVFLIETNNLSDLTNDATARTNLGLGTAATANTGTGASNVPTTSQADARYLIETSNLSDLTNDATARTNLSVYSKAEGDGRYLLESNNLSDVVSASTSRNNLGLGTAAQADTGTGVSNVPTTSQADARYLIETNNLSDLTNDATARTNLDVYSTSQVNFRTSDTPGDVSTYALLSRTAIAAPINYGQVYAGSILASTGVNNGLTIADNSFGGNIGTLQSGSWIAMGSCTAKTNKYSTTLFKRIS